MATPPFDSTTRRAFRHYLRTGRKLPTNLFAKADDGPEEVKFNPWHDRLGRFTFSPGGPRNDQFPDRRAVMRSDAKRPAEGARTPTAVRRDLAPGSGAAMDVGKPGLTPSSPNASSGGDTATDAASSQKDAPAKPSPIRSSEPDRAFPEWLASYTDRDKIRLITEPHSGSPLNAPDGAFYVVPSNVDHIYLLAALEHLRSMPNHAAVMVEFRRMYNDATNPYFIDFKKWGTKRGPAESPPVAKISYYSAARGETVTASPYEAFGNYFYGFAGTYANIAPEVLKSAAWLVQEGRRGFLDKYVVNAFQDMPEDVPHVEKGIADAKRLLARDQENRVFGVEMIGKKQ